VDVNFVDFPICLDHRSWNWGRIVGFVGSVHHWRQPPLKPCTHDLSDHDIAERVAALDDVGEVSMGHVLCAGEGTRDDLEAVSVRSKRNKVVPSDTSQRGWRGEEELSAGCL
jgi:hypothetical protein